MSPALHRRTVLRGALLGWALAVFPQAACTTGRSGDSPGPTSGSGTPKPSGIPSGPDSSTDARPSEVAEGHERSVRVLVAYFSRAGENYYYGDRVDLEVGNTEVLAGIISAHLTELGIKHDLHRIDAADRYPDDYDQTVARNVREQDTGARPKLANPLGSIDGYDVVLLGSPIWNVRPPMLMLTFAEAHDFTGKLVHPFVTYAVSGLGTVEDDYTRACRGADIGKGLAVRGETVREDAPDAAADWLHRIELRGQRP